MAGAAGCPIGAAAGAGVGAGAGAAPESASGAEATSGMASDAPGGTAGAGCGAAAGAVDPMFGSLFRNCGMDPQYAPKTDPCKPAHNLSREGPRGT